MEELRRRRWEGRARRKEGREGWSAGLKELTEMTPPPKRLK